MDILNALEAAFGINDVFVQKHRIHEPSGTTLRCLYYPIANSIDGENIIRAGAHTDYGSLTLLFVKDEVQGLQVFNSELQEFTSVKPIPGTLIVNTGDLLEFWTNGFIKSAIHRVSFIENSPRYSIAYFFHAEDDAVLHPLKGLAANGRMVSKHHEHSDLYTVKEDVDQSMTAKEHLMARLSQSHIISHSI